MTGASGGDGMTDTEDQMQPQIIEEAGSTTEKEKRLTLEAEQLIRKFMIRWVSLPAICLAAISFALGFFIEKVALQTASNQAFQSAQSEVMKLVEQVMDAKHKADAAASAIQTSSKEITKTEDKAKKFADELSSLKSKLDSTVAFHSSDPQIKQIADVLARDPRITNVLTELDKSVQLRLARADTEIGKIATSYKIVYREGHATHLENYKGVFAFPFPVKHAWVELGQGLPETYCITVGAIEDKSVTVIAGHTRTPRGRDYKEDFRWDKPRIGFRVWATSF